VTRLLALDQFGQLFRDGVVSGSFAKVMQCWIQFSDMNDLLESLHDSVEVVRVEEPPSQFGELSFEIFGLVFIAFCIWLTVRIINRREKWARRTVGVLLAMPVLYFLTFGPACWWFYDRPYSRSKEPIMHLGGLNPDCAPRIYWPIGWVVAHGPTSLADALFWYATRRHAHVALPTDSSGDGWYDSEDHSTLRALGRW